MVDGVGIWASFWCASSTPRRRSGCCMPLILASVAAMHLKKNFLLIAFQENPYHLLFRFIFLQVRFRSLLLHLVRCNSLISTFDKSKHQPSEAAKACCRPKRTKIISFELTVCRNTHNSSKAAAESSPSSRRKGGWKAAGRQACTLWQQI